MPNSLLQRGAPRSSGTTQTRTPAAPAKAAAPVLPFVIGARQSTRLSFITPTTAIGAGSAPLTPIQIPAVGYLRHIDLEVTIAGSGGTSPAFTADAPFNVMSAVELRNSSGNDLVAPITGYQLYLVNKYCLVGFDAPSSDARRDQQFANTAPSAHFFLRVPCEVSPADAFCAIPALASNRSYQLALSLNSLAAVISSNPTLNVTIQGVAWFWTEPVAQTKGGNTQATAPAFNGSLRLIQIEPVPLTPGDKYIKSNNVGNVLHSLVCTLRNASSVREDTDWPTTSELYLDNDPMYYLPNTQWLSWMSRLYNLTGSTKDVAGGLDTGVYVIPFFCTSEGAAIANSRRSQYLPTLDASLLQLRGTSWGATASTLEIITCSVVPTQPGGTSSSALYSLA